MLKSKRNYSFKKAGNKIQDVIAEMLTDMARYQNESIQRGIDTQTDINGKKYTKLSTISTLPIRNRRGHGFTPLDTMKGARQKKLRNTKVVRANRGSLVSQVLMLEKHGVYHNEGVPKSGGMIEDKEIPKREWFGITKEMKRGGSQYEKFLKMAFHKIKPAFNK